VFGWPAFPPAFPLADLRADAKHARMFSHIVVFWTDPAQPGATDELLTGCDRHLKTIPGMLHYHAGKMVGSHRPVVDQSYQVALNLVFRDKQSQDEYQTHPQHVEFVEKFCRRLVKRVVVYDFA
jgi:hypothetical protein